MDGYLEHEWNSDDEGDYTDEQHQELVTLQVLVDPLPEAVLQGGDDHFNGGELERSKMSVSMTVVVVKWSASSPSAPTISV